MEQLPMDVARWKRSTVHIECAGDSVPFATRELELWQARARLHLGEITDEDYRAVWNRIEPSLDRRHTGTAVYMVHRGRKILVTARHVLHDEESEKAVRVRDQTFRYGSRDSESEVFNAVFRVPTLSEFRDHKAPPGFPLHTVSLNNLGAGGRHEFSFSTPELDLAVISLERRTTYFANDLDGNGFVPIDTDDLADGPSKDAAEIFTVGFPGVSEVGRQQLDRGSSHRGSASVSVPIGSFGRVSMLEDDLPYFWADLSIYPGNSGGPVIEDNKLVGIVSGQGLVPLDSDPDTLVRVPFANVIKGKHLRSLIDLQMANMDKLHEFLRV
ncbi:S1 family peptidase [Enterovirga sp. CN4-39]|uniref:S1 family peptidase n=1 Tax=Enterovirga sp. CN4-39 TaxID=3400910 RepID=UPI003C072D50